MWHRAVTNNYPLLYLWPLTWKLTVFVRTAECMASEWIRNGSTNCSKQIHWMAERLYKVFEQMRLNGWMAEESFLTDKVERLYGWGKFLKGWGRMAEWLRKMFEQMRSNGWMAEENNYFWKDEVERLSGWWNSLSWWGQTAEGNFWMDEWL